MITFLAVIGGCVLIVVVADWLIWLALSRLKPGDVP